MDADLITRARIHELRVELARVRVPRKTDEGQTLADARETDILDELTQLGYSEEET
jgi:hypothetical protein